MVMDFDKTIDEPTENAAVNTYGDKENVSDIEITIHTVKERILYITTTINFCWKTDHTTRYSLGEWRATERNQRYS